jgi:hypothetical protein
MAVIEATDGPVDDRQGQSRHFGRWSTTSGLPPGADIFTASRHVSKVPTTKVQAGRAPLPMIAGIGTTNSPPGARKRVR